MVTRLHRFRKNVSKISWLAMHCKSTLCVNRRTVAVTLGPSFRNVCTSSSSTALDRFNSTGLDHFESKRPNISELTTCGCTTKAQIGHHRNINVRTWGASYSTSAEQTQLIYNGPLTTVVKGVKFFSLSTTIMSGALIPLLLAYGDSGLMTTIGVSFATMMIATPVVLHWFSRSYVTRLYFDKTKGVYVAKTVTFILREATHRFKAADVTIPPVRNLFTTFLANGRPFLVDPRGFFDPNHFSQLMGQDQITQEELEKMMKSMKDDED